MALVREGADVDAVEADGTSALHWAAHFGDAELLRALLAAGADATAANRYGMTPLQIAAVEGDVAVIEALLAAGADANAVLPEGETVLMTAARTGSADALRALLARGANVEARDSFHGESALIWAAAENHADAIRVLAEHGADVDGRSALLAARAAAAARGSIDPAARLLDAADVRRARERARGRRGARRGRREPRLGGPRRRHGARHRDHQRALRVRRALAARGRGSERRRQRGRHGPALCRRRHASARRRPRPRQSAAGGLARRRRCRAAAARARSGSECALKKPILQRQHTFGDGTLGAGATPLLRAAKSGDIELVRVLLAAGADPMATLPNGTTALMLAAGLGWRNGSPLAPSYDQGSDAEAVETLELLLSLGLDLQGGERGRRHGVACGVAGRGSEAIVRFLLERGADPSVPNGRQQTPLSIAEARSTEAIAALVRAAVP